MILAKRIASPPYRLALIGLLLLTACVSLSIFMIRRPHAAVTPNNLSLEAVEALPLYRQARQACAAGQYQRAATLLAQLASSQKLTRDQADFCRQQRDLCLQYAGVGAVPLTARADPPILSPSTPEEADCGPRALALICKQLGKSVDLARLRTLAGTTAAGTTMAGLAAAAKAIGWKAEGVQVNLNGLAHVPTPAIAIMTSGHYVCLISTQGEGADATATLQDPDSPIQETLPQTQFLGECGGNLLLLHR